MEKIFSDVFSQTGECVPNQLFVDKCNLCHCNGDGKLAACTMKACQAVEKVHIGKNKNDLKELFCVWNSQLRLTRLLLLKTATVRAWSVQPAKPSTTTATRASAAATALVPHAPSSPAHPAHPVWLAPFPTPPASRTSTTSSRFKSAPQARDSSTSATPAYVAMTVSPLPVPLWRAHQSTHHVSVSRELRLWFDLCFGLGLIVAGL